MCLPQVVWGPGTQSVVHGPQLGGITVDVQTQGRAPDPLHQSLPSTEAPG